MLELQRLLIGDSVRNEAFHSALKKIIKPGVTTVADIGSGTGFLSFLASRLGARGCHLYEYTDLLRLSKKIARLNSIKNCEFIHAHTRSVKSPPRADVVISETLGNFALEEHIIENMEDAKRFLKPGGILMPSRLKQYVIPVIHPRLTHELDTWKTPFDVDLSLARQASLNNMYVRRCVKEDLLQGPDAIGMWDEIDFYSRNKSIRSGGAAWHIKKTQRVYGFCIFWECELAPGVLLSTSPYSAPTHWDQIFLPLEKALTVDRGGRLEFSISSDSRYSVGLHVAWTAAVTSNVKQLAPPRPVASRRAVTLRWRGRGQMSHVKMDLRNGLN